MLLKIQLHLFHNTSNVILIKYYFAKQNNRLGINSSIYFVYIYDNSMYKLQLKNTLVVFSKIVFNFTVKND